MRPVRVVLVLGIALLGLGLSGPAAVPLLQAGRSDFPDLLAGAVCLVHAAVSAWLGVVALAVAFGRVPRRLAPRWLLIALVAGGGLAPGAAAADPVDHLGGLPLPDRPGAAQAPPPATADAPTPTPAPAPAGAHVVVPGDSLWAIARSHLPAGADPGTVADAVARWHGTNHAVIGADPDLIRPGQVLIPPEEPPS